MVLEIQFDYLLQVNLTDIVFSFCFLIQSLVMIFAHLTHTQMEALLAFLSNVPGPTGKPALHFVLTEWCSRQHLFYGAYENKVR